MHKVSVLKRNKYIVGPMNDYRRGSDLFPEGEYCLELIFESIYFFAHYVDVLREKPFRRWVVRNVLPPRFFVSIRAERSRKNNSLSKSLRIVHQKTDGNSSSKRVSYKNRIMDTLVLPENQGNKLGLLLKRSLNVTKIRKTVSRTVN